MPYRKIDTRIWSDERFQKMGVQERLLWFSLLTHPLMTPMGAGVIGTETLDACIGRNETFCSLCQDFCDTPYHKASGIIKDFKQKGMLYTDGSLIVMKNFLMYNTPDNPSILAGWIVACEELPRSEVFRELHDHLNSEMEGRPKWLFAGLLKPLSDQKPRRLKDLYWQRVQDFTDKPKGKGYQKDKTPPMTDPKQVLDTSLDNKNRNRNRIKETIDQISFDRFWSVYPRKIGKGAAKKAWIKLKPWKTGDLVEIILSAIEAQKPHWKDPQFIPHPATWLNQERWADSVEAEKPASAGPQINPRNQWRDPETGRIWSRIDLEDLALDNPKSMLLERARKDCQQWDWAL